MSRIGIVGTGHIAAPIVRHLASKGHEITVTKRNAAVSAVLAAETGCALADAQGAVNHGDVIFLCLRPHQAEVALEPLIFRNNQQIVSVMAGVSRATLEQLCAPAADSVQTIPLGFLQHGGCPLAAYGNQALLGELFAPENPIVGVANEQALNAHFAICAMVPGMLDLMATGANWLTEQTNEADASEFFVKQLLSGFLNATEIDSAGRLARERDALATEGTISLQMTEALHAGHAHKALRTALDRIGKSLQNA